LHYTCFYAVVALLIKNNISTQTHNGARVQFGLLFIKNRIIDKESGKLFSKLFDYRQKDDYGDLFDFDQELTEPLIDQVKDLLVDVKKHL
jgi:uncharacterized protein (UPF0332 family)